MIRTRRFPFSSPPLRLVLDYFLKDEDFIHFAKAIFAMENQQFEELSKHLIHITPFLDKPRLASAASRVLGDNSETKRIVDAIWQLSSILRSAEEPFSKSTEILDGQLRKWNKISEDEDDRTVIASRILTLAAAPVGFDQQFKAQRLANATGSGLSDCQIICDVRPIYSSARSSIEGAIVVTTLRLNIDDDDSQTGIDVRLTETQLHDLAEKAALAEAKLLALKSLLSEKGVALASVSGSHDDGGSK